MEVLEIILYLLGSILLVTLIVLSVKLIKSIDRINLLLDSVEQKMKTVDQVFGVIDKVADTFAIFSDKMVDGLSGFISKLFTRRKKVEKIKEEV